LSLCIISNNEEISTLSLEFWNTLIREELNLEKENNSESSDDDDNESKNESSVEDSDDENMEKEKMRKKRKNKKILSSSNLLNITEKIYSPLLPVFWDILLTKDENFFYGHEGKINEVLGILCLVFEKLKCFPFLEVCNNYLKRYGENDIRIKDAALMLFSCILEGFCPEKEEEDDDDSEESKNCKNNNNQDNKKQQEENEKKIYDYSKIIFPQICSFVLNPTFQQQLQSFSQQNLPFHLFIATCIDCITNICCLKYDFLFNEESLEMMKNVFLLILNQKFDYENEYVIKLKTDCIVSICKLANEVDFDEDVDDEENALNKNVDYSGESNNQSEINKKRSCALFSKYIPFYYSSLFQLSQITKSVLLQQDCLNCVGYITNTSCTSYLVDFYISQVDKLIELLGASGSYPLIIPLPDTSSNLIIDLNTSEEIISYKSNIMILLNIILFRLKEKTISFVPKYLTILHNLLISIRKIESSQSSLIKSDSFNRFVENTLKGIYSCFELLKEKTISFITVFFPILFPRINNTSLINQPVSYLAVPSSVDFFVASCKIIQYSSYGLSTISLSDTAQLSSLYDMICEPLIISILGYSDLKKNPKINISRSSDSEKFKDLSELLSAFSFSPPKSRVFCIFL
jgi:hypothetical protein